MPPQTNDGADGVAPVSSRSYLSIGDVLGLLRQEFPDVTISKIRVLESQGLVDPERTPSGYRKFYEHDVERLRWVLRQQREHFLPLKVIKGRLEQDEGDGDHSAYGAVDGDDVHDDDDVHDGDHGARPVPGVSRGERALVTHGAAAPGARAETGTGTAMRPDARVPVPASAGGEHAPSGRRPPSSPAPQPVRQGPSPSGVRTGVAARARPEAGTSRPATVPTVQTTATAQTAPTKPAPSATHAGARAQAAPTAAHPAEAPSVETLSGDAMTADELASASGLEVKAVKELDSFGLVSGRVVGGVTYYERDALDVARLAAGFARFGVEARHLRLHKHTAEREAGFIEQIVLPVLKQRNPEARQRALDTVAELSRLGQGLREVLLRSTLRDQLGG